MLIVKTKKSEKILPRLQPSVSIGHVHYPAKWRDESEGLKSHRDSETDVTINSEGETQNRSVSPTENSRNPFSMLDKLLNPNAFQFNMSVAPNAQNNNQKYKTELCKNYELYGYCRWADNCFFAHGKFELKSKTLLNNFYKTKICKHYHRTGFCPYAVRCQYFHFKSYQIYQELANSFENKVSSRINETNEKLDKILVKFERMQPRLGVFQQLAVGDKEKALVDKYVDNEF